MNLRSILPVRDNIIEIKKVKSEIQQQKAEINNVIQGYKDFVSDENQEKNAKEELGGENITKKIDEVKKQYDNLLTEKVDIKYDPKIKSIEEEISKLRRELENMKKASLRNTVLPAELSIRNETTISSGERLLGNSAKEIDLLICKDSNFRHIDYRKLWTIKNSERRSCSNLKDVGKLINDTDITTLHHILISTGVNDLDEASGIELFNTFSRLINQLKTKYPGIKIIMCEITPHDDERDEEVLKCNRMINSCVSSQANIYVAYHSNLRDDTFSLFRDNKHIKESKIAKFASNIKRAMRTAYGIIDPNSSHSNLTCTYNNKSYASQPSFNWHGRNQIKAAPSRSFTQQTRPDINTRLIGITNGYGNCVDHTNMNTNPNTTSNSILKQKIVDAFTQSMNSLFEN